MFPEFQETSWALSSLGLISNSSADSFDVWGFCLSPTTSLPSASSQAWERAFTVEAKTSHHRHL